MVSLTRKQRRERRHKKVRSEISGTSKIPRLCVSRSTNHIYCQIINDEEAKTILNSNDFDIKKPAKAKGKKEEYAGKLALAYKTGKLIADKAIEKGIKKVVFDRGGFGYHGRVKALAEGAREGGLEF